ncbi:MAG: DUF389 domain-containing protein [Anaerolineaceae bacterium]|nr:DUF389 domain-containing protein [Anaerolineaceae bacterium]
MDPQNSFHTWLSQYIKPLDRKRRKEIIENIRMAASPGFDYFFFVVLSGAIATLGLINDSPAVIIGAMVVAPLMSPILGVGLGSITADARLARDSASALIRGAVISVILAALLTLSNIYLPFVPSLTEIPIEILSRTQPTPNDLIIALAGGLAAAYALSQPHLSAALPGVAIATALMPPLSVIGIGIALGRWDIAGGATLLFLTNAVTIAFAAILVFFIEGFSPRKVQDEGRLPRTLWVSALLTLILLIPLTILGARFVAQAQENRLITNIVQTELANLNQAEIVELQINRIDNGVQLNLTISANTPPSYSEVVALQEALVVRLDQPVSLIMNYLKSERLDPLIPPTETPTLTPGPSLTPTVTQTMTATPTSTPAEDTATPTASATPTPLVVHVVYSSVPAYNTLYDEPGGSIVAYLSANEQLFDLYQTIVYDGMVWVNVRDEEGNVGWFPEIYLSYPTETATATVTPTVAP